jgi:hypothetical protein
MEQGAILRKDGVTERGIAGWLRNLEAGRSSLEAAMVQLDGWKGGEKQKLREPGESSCPGEVHPLTMTV